MSPALAPLLGALSTSPELARMIGEDPARIAAPESVRPYLLAALAQMSDSPVLLVVTPTIPESERLAHDLCSFLDDDRVAVFPAWETLPFERISPSVETMGRRVKVLHEIRTLDRTSTRSLVVVAPVKALLQRLAPGAWDATPLRVEAGTRRDIEEMLGRLIEMGYRREYQVEHRGEVALRGGIIDVYPSTGDTGVRIDCFGDEVDRLTLFDVADQRSVAELAAVEIHACREFIPDEHVRRLAEQRVTPDAFGAEQFARIADGAIFDGIESFVPWLATEEQLLTDLLMSEDRVVLIDPRRMRDRSSELVSEEESLAESLASTWGITADQHDANVPRLHLHYERLLASSAAKVASILPVADVADTPSLQATGWPSVVGEAAALARRLGTLARSGAAVVIAADAPASAQRLANVFESEGLEIERLFEKGESARVSSPGIHVVVAQLDKGFVLADGHVAVLAESDVTGRRRPHRVPRPRARAVEGFFDDLEAGSYVVHHIHGVARYAGMTTRNLGGVDRDYLLLEYRGGDKLYIPSDQIDTITPYSGGDQPSLSRLNGSEWQRQRARVRHAVQEVAQELVVLYQRRLATPGHAFASDTPWQAELEQSFPYPETVDQLRAINDVKADMERDSPMDRLVCGDVGFGKTEVALRAVFKAVQDNRQAAVLVPTTLLAQQHFQTFSERFAPYPVRVEMLSRFLSAKQARVVIEGLKDGSVDVVIGTHRLLADDVSFKNLGLLVVDEEQRFGVSHKEATKKLSVGVDVLTLTASPIPRTLEMGLTGIRDLSIIDTPPAERQPILTYVGEFDERAIAEAIRRELLREGQVFYVHNRVQDIERVAQDLRALVPEARVAVAHGQMDEGSLEKIVLDFSEGAYDVLVCTTIIESGIDMPMVNTLVVDRADLLGLGQLHQLRGRVGRAGQRAYAYLFHPADKVLSEQAYERLRTIGEHTELGSGFKIAMRDLEIRGAGNLLGTDQSGHIAAVGYDLYVQMVAEAVAELKGESVSEPAEIKIDLPLDAHLPASYVEREDLRLEAYRRLAAVRSLEQVADIENEWLDRFGPLPAPARALLDVARVRAVCATFDIREVTAVAAKPGGGGPARMGEVLARLSPIRLPASAKVRLMRLAPRATYKEDVGQVLVPIKNSPGLAAELVSLIGELCGTPLAPAVAGSR
jgi:transcription-repair coupling factor (superfamily II helicase)